MLIVLDTNVLVSAQLKRNTPPSAILDAILEKKLQIAVDNRILSEYQQVLGRPRYKFHLNKWISLLNFSCKLRPM